MPFVPGDPNDPNNQQGMNQLPATSGGGVGGPQGAAAIPNATKAPPVQDLKAYLEANAPQAVQMGQNIAGNLNEQAGKVTGDVNAAQGNVDQAVQGQTVAPNADLVSRAAANPSGFVTNPNDVAAFKAQRDAAYTGPSAFEQTPDFSAANAEVNAAVNALPDVTKPGGVDQLVRGQEKNPTLGMENLDTLLLQGNPNAMAPINAALPNVRGLGDVLKGATAKENAAIQDAVAKSNAAKTGVRDAFLTGPNAVAPAFQSGVNKEFQTDTDQVRSYNQALNDLIKGKNQANPQLSDLFSSVDAYNAALEGDLSSSGGKIGLPAEKHADITGTPEITYSPLKNPTAIAQPTLAQAATPQDIATQNALELLLEGNFMPSFDATGATPFKSPGSSPDLQGMVDPLLAELAPQIKTANPNVWNYNPNGLIQPSVDYVGNMQNALSALRTYLGEG